MLKKLFSDTAIYGLSSILGRFINYALVPLHTSAFHADSFGIISEFYAIAAILNVLYAYGMETAFFRFASKKEEDPNQIASTAFASLCLTSFLFSGSLIAFSQDIASGLGYPDDAQYVEWFAYILAIDAILIIPFANLRRQRKAKLFASLKLANILLNVGLNYYFLFFCKAVAAGEWSGAIASLSIGYDAQLGAGYAFLANLIANALVIPVLVPMMFFGGFDFSLSKFKEMIRYSLPLLIAGIAYTVNEVADRILLKHWLPDNFYEGKSAIEAVGIYSACYKLSIFIALATQAYKYAAEPFFFAKAQDKDSPSFYARTLTWFTACLLVMAVFVTANAHWIASLFLRKPEYLEALHTVPLLLFANIFLGIYFNLSIWYKATDKTSYGAMFSTVGALITLAANALLIPFYGYMGSAIATFMAYGAIACISYIIGQKHYPIPYDMKAILAGITIAGGACALFVWNGMGNGMPSILMNNFVAIIFLAIIAFKLKSELKIS